MKFAKELEQDLVPEWRAKYLDYKLGKKKLKAVARAIRAVDKTPGGPRGQQPTPFNSSPFRSAPVYSFINRTGGRTGAGLDPSGVVNPRSKRTSDSDGGEHDPDDEDATPRALASARADERRPLTGGISGRTDRQGMTRYGSIIGSPHDENSPLNQVRNAPSLELPEPAMPAESTTPSPRSRSPHSRGSQRKLMPSQDNRSTNAFEIGKTKHSHRVQSLAPRYRSIFHPKRVNSMPGTTDTRPFIKRVMSLGGGGNLQAPAEGDIALDAYREVDFRQSEFFMFLDKELEKIEGFYKSKEEQATERLKVLREQLHVMRDRRLEEIMTTSKAKAKTKANGNHEGTMNGLLAHFGSKHDEDRSMRKGHHRAASLPWLKPVGNAMDAARNGPIGKTTKAMEQLASPPGPHATNWDSRDYTQRPVSHDVPYRTAKRKLKIALAEFYRALELLKSYAQLNRTAFRKINKKFDKAANARPSGRYMTEKVNKAHFVNSDMVDGLIQTTEDLYARYFERGNHKIAVGKLRAKIAQAGDYTGSVFRNGLMAASGAVFGVEGLVYGSELLWGSDHHLALNTSYLLQVGAQLLRIGMQTLTESVALCRIFPHASTQSALLH
ncbi:Xenotropic and polytropic retrovirus receptor 1 [Elasticomyces elasticus]|nr:Xenotropic and polytropic retrovirus receptor 1 [Elasticomyces elasticus]